MAWTSSGSISPSSDWQYTEPITAGSFFRLKHSEAPNGGLFAIAQCEVAEDGKLSVIDNQVMAVEKPISDVLRLPKPGGFSERRIAIKKLPKQPSLEQEIRRLLLPGYLQPTEEDIRIVSRSKWSIDVEVSDFLEAVSNNESGSSGTSGNRPTDLNPLIYTASALEDYTYYQNYTIDKINNDDNASGVMKTSGGTANQLKVLATFTTPRIINKITLYLGQFNGYYNVPAELKIYAGSNDTGNLLLTKTLISEAVINIDTSSNSNFAQALSNYTFVFGGSSQISINELNLFGA